MKSFEYYSEPADVEYFSFVDRRRLTSELRRAVDAQKMTMLERQAALEELDRTVAVVTEEKNKLYVDACEVLKAEFWADARAELGYDKLFNAEGCELLEQDVWKSGQSHAFEDVFDALKARLEFVKQLIASQVEEEINRKVE